MRIPFKLTAVTSDRGRFCDSMRKAYSLDADIIGRPS